MASFTQILQAQLTDKASRSDVLRPLAWFVGLLLTAFLTGAYIKSPEWVLIALFIILALSAGLYMFAYLYCLLNDRDALRSEKFVTDKLAIEKGIYGDDQLGMVIEHAPTDTLALPSADKPVDEQK